MKPMNRHIKVDVIRQEPPDTGGVLLPDDYKDTKAWEVAKIEAVASNCESFSTDDVGIIISFPSHMLVSVDAMGEQYHFVQENYIVCASEPSME